MFCENATSGEILKQTQLQDLKGCLVGLDSDEVTELTEAMFEKGTDALEVLYTLRDGPGEMGKKYENEEYFPNEFDRSMTAAMPYISEAVVTLKKEILKENMKVIIGGAANYQQIWARSRRRLCG